jgi:hypothetical protein
MAVAYQEICEGESDPWVALGMFSHDFFGNFVHLRSELVCDPIREPSDATDEQHRWAVFCAASVEYLCYRYGVPCPLWVYDYPPLASPWYKGLGAHKPHVQQLLREETPVAFAKRNIFCGDRVFANKYEISTDLAQRRSA